MIVLLTGGVRSGKSALAGAPVYVAAGPRRDDQDWARRVAAHRARRPPHWATIELAADARTLPEVLTQVPAPLLVDCLGTWLTAQLDRLGAWEADEADWRPALQECTDALAGAVLARDRPAVLVTNEVGWGVVPAHRSGRLFADELGRLNQHIANHSDRVALLVAGQPLWVKGG